MTKKVKGKTKSEVTPAKTAPAEKEAAESGSSQKPAQQAATAAPQAEEPKPPEKKKTPDLSMTASQPTGTPDVVISATEPPPKPTEGSTPENVPVLSPPQQKQVSPPQKEMNLQRSPKPQASEAVSGLTSNQPQSNPPAEKPQTDEPSKPDVASKALPVTADQKTIPTAVKEAPSNQPSKKPAGKQSKRQAGNPNSSSASDLKGESNVVKLSEPNVKKNSHGNVTENPVSSNKTEIPSDSVVGKGMAVPAKEESTKQPIKSASDAQSKQKSESEIPGETTVPSQPKPKDSAAAAEKVQPSEIPEVKKDVTVDTKVGEQKAPSNAGTQAQPAPTKSIPAEKANKNTATKKNKQKTESSSFKPEAATNSKDTKSVGAEAKAETLVAGSDARAAAESIKSSPAALDSSEKSPLHDIPKIVPNASTLEASASNNVKKANVEDSKDSEKAKITHTSNEGKSHTADDDTKINSSNKKKNRQQKKSEPEDLTSSGKSSSTTIQEAAKSKDKEKEKPAPVSPPEKQKSKKTVTPAPAEKSNVAGVSGDSTKTGSKGKQTKSQLTTTEPVPATTNDADKGEPQQEDQSASKKKKRNRHKKKSQATDSDLAVESTTTEAAKADNGELKAKEKQQPNRTKGQVQAKKGAQPAPGAKQEEQAQKEGVSDAVGQTPSAKKRNRRKKKATSALEEDSNVSHSKEKDSAESREKTAMTPEEQKKISDDQPMQSGTDESQKKKSNLKPKSKIEVAVENEDVQFSESTAAVLETDDQLFVEVKSKSKRNKKKKLNTEEALTDNTSFPPVQNETSKVDPGSIVGSVDSNMVKVETGNAVEDSTKGAANMAAAPKISQEAREQKMLNKKLAERAHQKIQKQIETNCLSEAEQSEKYLETITKNLKELTKLRSSRLEDVLQKSGLPADGEEEFEYEYAPVQRTTFLATTCHVCKELRAREALKSCDQCHLVSYCSDEHRKADWPAHKGLCQAICEICKERGSSNLFAPAVGLSAEEYRRYRMNALLECSAILNRQLEPFEQEMILYPNVCHTCHLPAPAKLQTCEICNMVSYCSPEHRPPNHEVWCPDLQLYKSLIIYQSRNGVINPQLPLFLPETFQPPVTDMQVLLQTLAAGKDASPLERAVLSEIATAPLTTLFALHKANKVCEATEKLVVHFVGAEWSFELERADKWEAMLLHLAPRLQRLELVFVGPEVCALPQEARGLLLKQAALCQACQQAGRRVELTIAPQPFYHEYAASDNYVKPDIICAFNAGLYRPNGYKEVDSWADTLGALLRDPGVPVAVTSYTAEEVLKDAERLQRHRPLHQLLPPAQNPYRSLRPNRNFASDDVTPVIFKNYYITIATALAQ